MTSPWNIHLENLPSSKDKVAEDVSKKLQTGIYAQRSSVKTYDDLKNVAKFKIDSAREDIEKIKQETTNNVGENFEFIRGIFTERILRIIEEEKQKMEKEKNKKNAEKNIVEIEESMQKIIDISKEFDDMTFQLKEKLSYVMDAFRDEVKRTYEGRIEEGLSR